MTAATMLKRISTLRKDIAKYNKEIANKEKDIKEYKTQNCPNWEYCIEDCKRWIAYYNKMICKTEAKIGEMSKEAAAIATEEEEKEMVQAMADDMMKRGVAHEGYTTKGLRYWLDWNNGWTERSAHCFTMRIEGHGLVFTSGDIKTVAAYILHN